MITPSFNHVSHLVSRQTPKKRDRKRLLCATPLANPLLLEPLCRPGNKFVVKCRLVSEAGSFQLSLRRCCSFLDFTAAGASGEVRFRISKEKSLDQVKKNARKRGFYPLHRLIDQESLLNTRAARDSGRYTDQIQCDRFCKK